MFTLDDMQDLQSQPTKTANHFFGDITEQELLSVRNRTKYTYIGNNPLSGTDPSGYVADKEIESETQNVEKTASIGSRIKNGLKVTTTTTFTDRTSVVTKTLIDSNGARSVATGYDADGAKASSAKIFASRAKVDEIGSSPTTTAPRNQGTATGGPRTNVAQAANSALDGRNESDVSKLHPIVRQLLSIEDEHQRDAAIWQAWQDLLVLAKVIKGTPTRLFMKVWPDTESRMFLGEGNYYTGQILQDMVLMNIRQATTELNILAIVVPSDGGVANDLQSIVYGQIPEYVISDGVSQLYGRGAGVAVSAWFHFESAWKAFGWGRYDVKLSYGCGPRFGEGMCGIEAISYD